MSFKDYHILPVYLFMFIIFSFMEVVKCLKLSIFTIDPHIPDLLVFSASTDFHTNKLYVSGEIILQDKVRGITTAEGKI